LPELHAAHFHSLRPASWASSSASSSAAICGAFEMRLPLLLALMFSPSCWRPFSAAAPLLFLAAVVPLLAPLMLLVVAAASGGCSPGGGLRFSLCFLQLSLVSGRYASRSGAVKPLALSTCPPSPTISTNPTDVTSRDR
jgi:hypothetical protein